MPQQTSKSGRWGVVIFWCLVLLAVGIMLRITRSDQRALTAPLRTPAPTVAE